MRFTGQNNGGTCQFSVSIGQKTQLTGQNLHNEHKLQRFRVIKLYCNKLRGRSNLSELEQRKSERSQTDPRPVLIDFMWSIHSLLSECPVSRMESSIREFANPNGDGGKQNHLFVLYTSQRIHYYRL